MYIACVFYIDLHVRVDLTLQGAYYLSFESLFFERYSLITSAVCAEKLSDAR